MPILYKVSFVSDNAYGEVSYGIVYADGFKEAVAQLEEYYGKNDLLDVYVTAIEKTPIVLNEAIFNNLVDN